MKRGDRFGDNGDLIFDKGGQATYFAGRFSDARMGVIRNSILDIRSGWSSQNGVPGDVIAFVESLDISAHAGVTAADILGPVERSFALNRNWADRTGDAAKRTEFPMLRHYTDDIGYRTLFSAINARYRSDAESADHRPFRPVTWLIELLNMELFAVSLADPSSVGDRIVHRGTVFPDGLLDRYRLFEEPGTPRTERSISIPLGLHSATGDRDVAEDFIRRNSRRGGFGVVWTIHIVGLADRRLALYHRHFPESVVSAICAADISRLSAYKEAEVLLRGPFFDVLGCRPVEPIEGLPVFELAAVALNSNRDHVSTYELGDRDAAARDLFGKLVAAEKYQACADVAAGLGKSELATHYSAAADEAELQAEAADRRLTA